MLPAPVVAWMLLVGLMVLGAGVVSGQNYPNRPVRIVSGETGGSSDLAARLIAQGLVGNWGQQIIVDNRGGNAIIPAQLVAQAPPDGYTLLLYADTIWILPLLQDNVPYDPIKDFSPVILPVSSPTVLVVHPSLPVTSVRELIALAKTKPGELNYASGVSGGINHLSLELFKAMAGVNIMRVPYKGAGPAVNALIGGETQLMFPAMATGMPHVKTGRLRALAITSAQPSALALGLPTVSASGVPGYESTLIVGVLAPAGTPLTLINRLNQEIIRVLNRADVKEKFFNTGTEVIASTPGQLGATIKSGMAKWGKVIKDAGIRGD